MPQSSNDGIAALHTESHSIGPSKSHVLGHGRHVIHRVLSHLLFWDRLGGEGLTRAPKGNIPLGAARGRMPWDTGLRISSP